MPNWAYNEISCQNEQDFTRLKECLLNDGNVDFNRIVPKPEILDKMPGTNQRRHIMAIAFYLGQGKPVNRIEVCNAIHEHYPNIQFITPGKDDVEKIVVPAKAKQKLLKIDMQIPEMIARASNESEEIAKENDHYAKGKSSMPDFYQFDSYADYGKAALKCLLNYGCFDWYEWSTNFWGTKWNACETHVDDDNMSIYFETAWSPVPELIQKLSAKLRMPIYMQFSEEQFSAFAGEYVFFDGNVIEAGDYDYNDGNLENLYKTACRMQDPDQEYHRLKDGDIVTYYDESDEEDGLTEDTFNATPTIDTESEMYRRFMGETYELATVPAETD